MDIVSTARRFPKEDQNKYDGGLENPRYFEAKLVRVSRGGAVTVQHPSL